MIVLRVEESLISRELEQSFKRARKKVERELMYHPNAKLHFTIFPKTKKQNVIQMHVEYANQRLFEQEFSAKMLESSFDQSVDYLIRAIKEEFPLHKSSAISCMPL